MRVKRRRARWWGWRRQRWSSAHFLHPPVSSYLPIYMWLLRRSLWKQEVKIRFGFFCVMSSAGSQTERDHFLYRKSDYLQRVMHVDDVISLIIFSIWQKVDMFLPTLVLDLNYVQLFHTVISVYFSRQPLNSLSTGRTFIIDPPSGQKRQLCILSVFNEYICM